MITDGWCKMKEYINNKEQNSKYIDKFKHWPHKTIIITMPYEILKNEIKIKIHDNISI